MASGCGSTNTGTAVSTGARGARRTSSNLHARHRDRVVTQLGPRAEGDLGLARAPLRRRGGRLHAVAGRRRRATSPACRGTRGTASGDARCEPAGGPSAAQAVERARIAGVRVVCRHRAAPRGPRPSRATRPRPAPMAALARVSRGRRRLGPRRAPTTGKTSDCRSSRVGRRRADRPVGTPGATDPRAAASTSCLATMHAAPPVVLASPGDRPCGRAQAGTRSIATTSANQSPAAQIELAPPPRPRESRGVASSGVADEQLAHAIDPRPRRWRLPRPRRLETGATAGAPRARESAPSRRRPARARPPLPRPSSASAAC